MIRTAYIVGAMIWLIGPWMADAQEVAWTYTPPQGYSDTSSAVGDLNGDGKMEIVLATTSGQVFALDGKGHEIWHHDVGGIFSFPPTIADVTGDANVEVLILNMTGTVQCLEGSTGKLIWDAVLPGHFEWGTTTLAAGDVDGDGGNEIVTGDADGTVYCLRGSGEQVWTFKGDLGKTTCPAIADLDGDGKAEILIGGNKTPLVCLSAVGKELWRVKDGIGGSPFVYNLDGQGAPEIVTGIGANVTVIDAAGKMLWNYPMKKEIDSALSIGDANGDGTVEIYAVDLAGNLVCLSPKGQALWTANVVERVRRSPSLGDIDGDGKIEILVAGYSKMVHVFDAEGQLKASVSLPSQANATAALAVLGDLGLCAIVPLADAPVQVLRWPGTKPDAPVIWPEFRYNAMRTGSIPADLTKKPVKLTVDFGRMYVGANLIKAVVTNPERRALTVRIEAVREKGEPWVGVVESSEEHIDHQLSYAIPNAEAVNLSLVCTVSEGKRALVGRTRSVHVVPFQKEIADAGNAINDVEARVPKLIDRNGIEEKACFLRTKIIGLRDRVAAAGTMEESDRITLRDELTDLIGKTDALQHLTKAAEEAAAAGSTVRVCAANPWAPFGGLDELVEGRFGTADMTIEAFGGETESAALNVFNLSSEPRLFRINVDGLKQGDTVVPSQKAVVLYETVGVPSEMRDRSVDALPRLNPANLFEVPAWSARQLWINVDTRVLPQGDWTGFVHLKSLDITPVETSASLSVKVWNTRVPEKQTLRNCSWGYVHTSSLKDYPEEALADQVQHGTNVFVATFAPEAKFDPDGNLVGEIDFRDHDAYVKRHAPHGFILFCGYQSSLKGPAPIESDIYGKAHVQWLRAWVRHLAELGVGYDGFALYPVDEPGLSEGLVNLYLRAAKLAREADPKILLYTDPVARITVDELQSMLPYVDIWCPNRGGLILQKINVEKLNIIKNSGKPVWTYECDANVKHQSPLGYYRGQAWLAWHHGITGIGFWTYCTSPDDPWFKPPIHDYMLVYPGTGVVSSKRWEAVRDGVEDYSMLTMLKQAIETKGASAKPEDLEAAKQLLSERAMAVGNFCGVDTDKTEPGKEGLPGTRRIEDRRWAEVQSVRRDMARLLTVLGTP